MFLRLGPRAGPGGCGHPARAHPALGCAASPEEGARRRSGRRSECVWAALWFLVLGLCRSLAQRISSRNLAGP
ncbi:unnamed protein product [Rangifer tarandus platyrhynchus]|uniref:Uncharacterized protein n=2 Tax=Rangifer tarandus platyrhynchus TaxID=3082113 RepID=A0ABN8YXZ2_RANTA|nr:unnamed protein product [Rangifer tarandus platyrhynchus]CAI9694390.1 unnamed protein product [Rangifer tarandus platyrhynchus]